MSSSSIRTPLFVVGFISFLLVLSTATAFAGTIFPGTYRLLDHGDGALGPDYGLRVDSINELFSVELGSVQTLLTWNGGATATISGTLHNNVTTDIWQVSYVMTGVVAAASNLGFTATAGTGTLTDPLLNVTAITGEQDGSGLVFRFLADGHRIAGDSDSAVGRGWLLPPNSTDDWLVRAELIPEPTSALLLSLALASLSFYRRNSTTTR